MTSFQPVDYDPFAAAPPAAPAEAAGTGGGRPLTIRGSQPKFEPVDYDPFASDTSASPSWLDTAKDVAQSAGTGIERGAIGLATLPATIGDLGQRGTSAVMDYFLGPKPDSGPATPLHAFASNPDLPGLATRAVELGGAAPMYQPQTTPGRYAQTVGEFVGGGAGGKAATVAKTAGNVLKYGILPGLASEGAGEATQGTQAEPWARAIAPVLVGGGAALAGRPGTAGQALRDAAGPLDSATLDSAQQLMDAATARGAPLSLAEAVQQVTNSGTRLGSLQRVVEQSRGGAAPMARFYADRPGQVRDAGTAAIDRIGPVPANPSEVAPAVQQAAESTIGDAYRARTDAVRPLYRAAATDTVPAERIDAILADLDRQIADDKTGLLAGPLGDLRQRLSYKAPASEIEVDPAADMVPTGAPRAMPPVEAYMDKITPVRPEIPRPQSLQDFVRKAGGVQDPRGDLKSMGLDLVRGLVAKPGQGLGPDAMRQIAAEAGYLGPDIDHAMANTTVNDFLDALGEHPLYSVRDAGAVHAWDAHDLARSEADRIGRGGSPAGPAPRDVPLDGLNGGPGEQAAPKRLPITDIENLDRTRKFFRDRTELPQFAPNAIDKETGARVGDTLDTLDKAMTDASSSFRVGKERYQDITRTKVEPLENGMIGALSKSREFGAQAKIILGENPLPGSAAEVANAVEAVKAKAPAAARALVSQRIRQVFNEATQTNVGGPNQWGGAKFNAVISGNDQQARNLKAAVEALHGPGVWRDFQKTLEVFEAMGRRQAPGSGTEFNRQIATELQRGGLMGEAASTAASPSTWLSKAREIYEGWRYGRNTEALAAMLTQPDAAKRLAAIAKAPVGSAESKGMAALYLLGAAANQGRKGEAK